MNNNTEHMERAGFLFFKHLIPIGTIIWYCQLSIAINRLIDRIYTRVAERVSIELEYAHHYIDHHLGHHNIWSYGYNVYIIYYIIYKTDLSPSK